MKVWKLLVFGILLLQVAVEIVGFPQDEGGTFFNLPVQLVGFPFIIMAVRLSNFVKKLAYSLSPSTYIRRSKRETDFLDFTQVEKKLVAELGDDVCIYESVCEEYAKRSDLPNKESINWNKVFKKYRDTAANNRKYYLLSVFLGDIVGSPNLCNQLAKRGRKCRQ